MKVLGVLCMIDDGEADWKVVVIDAADPWGESTAAVVAAARSRPTLHPFETLTHIINTC